MKPHLLFVSPVFLFPNDAGGKIRSTNILRGLRSGAFELTLMSPASPDQMARWKTELEGAADHFIAWRPSPPRPRWRRAIDLLGDLPVNVAADNDPVARAAVRDALRTGRYDLVVFDFVHAAVLAPADAGARSVCFTHNIEAEIFERHAQQARQPWMRHIWRTQHAKMKRFEQRALNAFDAVITVSGRDAQAFRRDYGLSRVHDIPTGVDLDHFTWSLPPPVTPQQPPVAVFIGAMDWAANVDGVNHFLDHVWPKVIAECPSARFVIVGRQPPAALQARAQGLPGVGCTGYVDDVRPYARDAQAFVIPLRVGGGTRIKAFEAMAMGCPVVSTTIGMEGLDVRDGEHYLCRDDPEGQARAVLDLFRDADLRERLSRGARQRVEGFFGHRKAASVFETICLDALDTAPDTAVATTGTASRQTRGGGHPMTPSGAEGAPSVPDRPRPMRILYHHRTASKDGQAVHIEEMIEALRGLGHEVRVVAPAVGGHEGHMGDDVGWVHRLKAVLPRALYELMELSYSLVAYRKLVAAAREFRPDVIYERYNLFLLAGVMARRKLGLPLLLEVNAPLVHEREQHSGGLSLKRLARWAEGAAWRGADAVLPVTAVLAGHVRAYGVPAGRIHVVPNGINRAHFAEAPARDEAKRRLNLQGRLVLGFTGFVREWHGVDRIIDWMATPDAPPEAHLLMVGDGPVRGALEAQAARLGLSDRVTFTGVVHRDAVPAHVAAFDIALQPAVTPYASPLKLMEYLALGKAVVAPATPNLMEVLSHELNALLFEEQGRGALEAALTRVCRDAALRERLGEGSADTIDRLQLTWAGNARRAVALAEAAQGRGLM